MTSGLMTLSPVAESVMIVFGCFSCSVVAKSVFWWDQSSQYRGRRTMSHAPLVPSPLRHNQIAAWLFGYAPVAYETAAVTVSSVTVTQRSPLERRGRQSDRGPTVSPAPGGAS